MGRGEKIVTNVFTRRMFNGFLSASLFSSVGLAFANIADSLVVGMRIGEAGLAAIGITSPIYMLFAFFYIAIGTGGSVEFAKLSASEDGKKSSDLFSMMMTASCIISGVFVFIGIFFTPQTLAMLGVTPKAGEVYRLSYDYAHILLCAAPVFFLNTPFYMFIRCDNARRLATFGFVAGTVIDVVLNFVFVLGMDLGVTGTIWSTIIGQSAALMIYIPHFFKKEAVLKIKLIKPEFGLIFKTLLTGFSVSVQYIFQFVFIIAANYVLLRNAGDYAVAVFDVVLNVSYIGLCIHNASNEAMQPLTGMFCGEHNPVEQKNVHHMAQAVGITAGSALLFTLAVFSTKVCQVYHCNTSLGRYAIVVYCIGAVFAGINTIACGFYQSTGREKLAFFLTMLRTAVFLIAFTLVLGSIGIHAFWWTFPATELLSLLVTLAAKRNAFFKSSAAEVCEERILSFFLDGGAENHAIPNEQIEEFCRKWGADARQTYYVMMTAEEICTAIIENVFSQEENMYLQITLIACESGDMELHIRDNATCFNPFDLKTEKVSIGDCDEELRTLGILMVKKKAKKWFYRRYQGLNTLIVTV